MAIPRKMAELQGFSKRLIAGGKRINRLQCRLINHATIGEVHSDRCWITGGVKQLAEPVCRAKEQGAFDLIDLGTFRCGSGDGVDALCVIPGIS